MSLVGKPFVSKIGVPSATALLGFLEGGGAVELQNSMRGMGGPHAQTVVACCDQDGHGGLILCHAIGQLFLPRNHSMRCQDKA